MSKDTESFYKTKAWRATRDAYMRADVVVEGEICPSGCCEECFKKGIFTPAEIVHHKVWLNKGNMNDPAITLGWDNLERVCRPCHAAIHYPDQYVPRVGFTPDGRVFRLG